jgi:hypothetical protein
MSTNNSNLFIGRKIQKPIEYQVYNIGQDDERPTRFKLYSVHDAMSHHFVIINLLDIKSPNEKPIIIRIDLYGRDNTDYLNIKLSENFWNETGMNVYSRDEQRITMKDLCKLTDQAIEEFGLYSQINTCQHWNNAILRKLGVPQNWTGPGVVGAIAVVGGVSLYKMNNK